MNYQPYQLQQRISTSNARPADWTDADIALVKLIVAAATPALSARAHFAGHHIARALDCSGNGDALPFGSEVTAVSQDLGDRDAPCHRV